MSYAANLATAKRLLSSKGRAVTLTIEAASSYDPASASVTITPTTVTTTGVVLPLSRGLMFTPGSTIQEGDEQLLLPGDIDEPQIGSRATIGGVPYTIADVKTLNPGGTTILYDCVIRL